MRVRCNVQYWERGVGRHNGLRERHSRSQREPPAPVQRGAHQVVERGQGHCAQRPVREHPHGRHPTSNCTQPGTASGQYCRSQYSIVRNVRYENVRMDDIRRAIALNQVLVEYSTVGHSTVTSTRHCTSAWREFATVTRCTQCNVTACHRQCFPPSKSNTQSSSISHAVALRLTSELYCDVVTVQHHYAVLAGQHDSLSIVRSPCSSTVTRTRSVL